MIKVYIANNAAALEALQPHITIEAEYGDTVVEGSALTLAHHGPRADQPCPCLGDNLDLRALGLDPEEEVRVGISHFDLDTLGGLTRVFRAKNIGGVSCSFEAAFWAIAAEVDTRGPHHLRSILEGHTTVPKYQTEMEALLAAFWAWSEAHRLFAPRDGSVQECTEFVEDALQCLQSIFHAEAEAGRALIGAGQEWLEANKALNRKSFIAIGGGAILRQADRFVNHLYELPDQSEVLKAVVAFNTKFKSVTVSLADPIKGVSCREVVQDLWGPEAGGHDGIAGSPRGQEMTLEDAKAAVKALAEVMS